jgi:hypothetical protein
MSPDKQTPNPKKMHPGKATGKEGKGKASYK